MVGNIDDTHSAGADFLPVKILFNGRPARYRKVFATYSGFFTEDDFALAIVADGEGIAWIRLTHRGPWLVKANMRMPAPDDMKDAFGRYEDFKVQFILRCGSFTPAEKATQCFKR